MGTTRDDEARNFLRAEISESLNPQFRRQTFEISIFGRAQNLNAFLGEVTEETGQSQSRSIDGRLANLAMETHARPFQLHLQLVGMAPVKRLDGNDRDALSLTTRGSDGLRRLSGCHGRLSVARMRRKFQCPVG